MKRTSPAALRNREPISLVLESYLLPAAKVLEVASGTGEHGVYFTDKIPDLIWQPSDIENDALASIQAYREESGEARLLKPLKFDVLEDSDLEKSYNAVFCANMIHIAPPDASIGLIKLARKALVADGLFFLYGPFKNRGMNLEPSNQDFDENLRRRNPDWGIRTLEDIIDQAASHGFELVHQQLMPANNRILILRNVL
tara:strand:+ start:129 stop:725 length:597 start_codon:yes stop_codon:yes gene_type:complete